MTENYRPVKIQPLSDNRLKWVERLSYLLDEQFRLPEQLSVLAWIL